MDYANAFRMLGSVVEGLALLMGDETEIALHDLMDRRIVQISNGHITGRSAGCHYESAIYDAVLSASNKNDCLVGYQSHTESGKLLRASHIVIRDDNGIPFAMICFNQDTAKLCELRDRLDAMVHTRILSGEYSAEPRDENYIRNVTRQVILESIQRVKPTLLDTKEAKLDVLRSLDEKGVFSVRDAVPYVCDRLSISQATLYNYLREIHAEQ